jgi:transcriptional regulator with XRE-family HTH domain
MKLADYLKANGIPASRFRRLLNIRDRSTLWRWLNGTRIPRAERLQQIEHLTNGQVTAADFQEAPSSDTSAAEGNGP